MIGTVWGRYNKDEQYQITRSTVIGGACIHAHDDVCVHWKVRTVAEVSHGCRWVCDPVKEARSVFWTHVHSSPLSGQAVYFCEMVPKDWWELTEIVWPLIANVAPKSLNDDPELLLETGLWVPP